jgi:hypothetical protein
MKIVKRCAYMIYEDELVRDDLILEWDAKHWCKHYNEINDDRMVFYQVVSDEYKLKPGKKR